MDYPIIIIAEEGEMKLIDTYLPQCVKQDRSNVVITGVGAINIFRSLEHIDKNTPVINIGYAGSANYEIGTVALPQEVRLNHPNVTYPEPELKIGYKDVENVLKQNGFTPVKTLCYSNCDFVLQSDYKGCVFDMELAFIAAMGFKHLQSVKIVSDNLSLHTYREYGSGVDENK
jgi:hypothetical protein